VIACASHAAARGRSSSLEQNAQGQAAASTEPVGFANAYSRYVMGVLFLVYVVSYVDRQLMAVLLDPIKQDLGASDAQMGLLTGIAFAIFYSVFGLPIARLADRSTRRTVIAVCVAAWSAMTALTGWARSYAEIALARIGVGVGEAGGGAPAHSVLSDHFPTEQRGRALALLSSGGAIGMMLGTWIGGYLGDVYGWRQTFVLLGAPGIAVALLVYFTVREPQRGRFDTTSHASERLGPTIVYLWQRKTFVYMTIAATLHVFAGFGAGNWHPSFLRRVHGLTGTELGFWLGPVTQTCAFLGGNLFGFLSDRLGKRDLRWYMWVPLYASLVTMPFSYGFLLVDDFALAMSFMIPAALLGNSYAGVTFAMAQSMARPRMRATAAAIVLFVMNVGGLGMGPTVFGAMSTWLTPRFGDESIRVALLIVGIPHLIACVFNWLAARTLREDLAAAQRDSAEASARGSVDAPIARK
jgi:predicted MFS family arabinose efflux permease